MKQKRKVDNESKKEEQTKKHDDRKDEQRLREEQRRLCSTNHNVRSMAQLKSLETSESKKRPSNNDSVERKKQESTIRGSYHSNRSGTHSPRDKNTKDQSVYVCQCCRQRGLQELYLKFRTQSMKTTFLREQIDKMKKKLLKTKEDENTRQPMERQQKHDIHQVSELKTKLKKVTRQNVQFADKIQDQKQQIKMLKALIENEKQHLNSTDGNYEKLHRQYIKLQAERDSLLQKHNDIKNSNDKMLQLRAELEREFEKNLQELQLANEEINYLRIENEKVKNKKVEYERLYENIDSQLRQLRNRYNNERQKLTKSRNRLEEQYAAKLQELEQFEKSEQRVISLMRQNEQLRKDNDYKAVQVAEAMKKVQQQERELVLKDDELKKLARENGFLQADVMNCRKEIEELNVDIVQLKRTTENYKNRQLMRSKKSLFDEEQLQSQNQMSTDSGRENKLKALADIQSLIRRHRQQLD